MNRSESEEEANKFFEKFDAFYEISDSGKKFSDIDDPIRDFNNSELEIISIVERQCGDTDPELRCYINELIEPIFTVPTPLDTCKLLVKIGQPLPEPEASVFDREYKLKNRTKTIRNTVRTSNLRQIYPIILVLIALGYSDAEAIEICLEVYEIELNAYKSTKKCNQSKKGGAPDYLASALSQFRRDCKQKLPLVEQLAINPYSEVDLDQVWGVSG